jgi:hypothetical protein
MARYYASRPSVTVVIAEESDNEAIGALKVSEFYKHHETLLTGDAAEGWASELRRYLGSMQRDVKKDTDVVKWWQVSGLRGLTSYLLT